MVSGPRLVWTEDALVREFGCVDFIHCDRLPFILPQFYLTPDYLRSSPPFGSRSEPQLGQMNGVMFSDQFSETGVLCLTRMGANVDLNSVTEVTEREHGYVYTHKKILSEINGDQLLFLTTSRADTPRSGHKSVGCARVPSLEARGEIVFTDRGPFIEFTQVLHLFRIALTLPANTYLDCTRLDTATTVALLELFLGLLNWNYFQPRKFVLSKEVYTGVTLSMLTPRIMANTQYLYPPAICQLVPYAPRDLPLRRSSKRPSVGHLHASGVRVFSVDGNGISFRQEISTSPRINQDPIVVFVTETKHSRNYLCSGSIGRIEISVTDSVAPLTTIDFTLDFIVIKHKPLDGDATVSTVSADNTITVSSWSRTSIVQLFHHCASFRTGTDFFVDFHNDFRSAQLFVETFLLAECSPFPLHIRCELQVARFRDFPLEDLTRLSGLTWAISPAVVFYCDGPESVLGEPSRDIHAVDLTVKTFHEIVPHKNFATRTECVNTGVIDTALKTTLALKYYSTWVDIGLDILVPYTRPTAGLPPLGIVSLELDKTGFSFQHCNDGEWFSIDAEHVEYNSKNSVIGLFNVTSYVDPDTAVVASRLLFDGVGSLAMREASQSQLRSCVTLDVTLKNVEGWKQKYVKKFNKKHVICGFTTAYYDDVMILGYLVGILSGDVSISIKNPSKCLQNFYNAVHPTLPFQIVTGRVLIPHEFKPLGIHGVDGFLDYMAATTSIRETNGNMLILARATHSSCRRVFTPVIAPEKNREIVENVLQAHLGFEHMLEKYSQWFGPVIRCAKYEHKVKLGTDDYVNIVRVSDVYRSNYDSQIANVVLNRVKYNIISAGFSPIIIVEDEVYYFDLRCTPIAALTVESNWHAVDRDVIKQQKINLDHEYDIVKLNHIYDLKPVEIDLGLILADDGHKDPLSDPIFRDFLGVDEYMRCHPIGVSLMENLTFRNVRQTNRPFTYTLMDDGGISAYAGNDSRGQIKVSTNVEFKQQLYNLIPDAKIAFDTVTLAPWLQYRNKLFVGPNDDTFVRMTTVLFYQKLPSDYIPVKKFPGDSCMIILDSAPAISNFDVMIQEGMYFRKQPPWEYVITLTRDFLLFGVLLAAVLTYDNVTVLVKHRGWEALVATFALFLAPVTIVGKRIHVLGQTKNITVFSFPEIVVCRLSRPFAPRIILRNSSRFNDVNILNPDVIWRVDTDTLNLDPVLGTLLSKTRVLLCTGEELDVGPADLVSLFDFMVANVPAAVSHGYLDPINRMCVFENDFWFHCQDPTGVATVLSGILAYSVDAAQYRNVLQGVIPVLNHNLSSIGEFVVPRNMHAYSRAVLQACFNPATIAHVDSRITLRSDREYSLQECSEVTCIKWFTCSTPTEITLWNEFMSVRVKIVIGEYHGGISIINTLDRNAAPQVCLRGGSSAAIGVYLGPKKLTEAFWFFHGLCGEEPVIHVTSSNLILVAGAIRTFMITYRECTVAPVTFENIVLKGPLLNSVPQRTKLLRYLMRPMVYQRTMYTATISERECKKRTLQDETLGNLRNNQAQMNQKFLFQLQRKVTGTSSVHYRRRIANVSGKDRLDYRWIGQLFVSDDFRQFVSPGDIDNIITYQNSLHSVANGH